MKRSRKDEAVTASNPSWQSALLVCKACGKRSSGPRRIKPKAVVGAAKRLLRASRPRLKVVMTTCLGLCPKGALAVAMVGGKPGGARIIAVDTLKSFRHLLPSLVEPPTRTSGDPPSTPTSDPSLPATTRKFAADAVLASGSAEQGQAAN